MAAADDGAAHDDALPRDVARTPIGDLSYDQLLEAVELLGGGGINLGFAGKTTTRRLARRIRPRVMRRIAKYGVGTEEQRSLNRLIEGDNLQAMTTLYKERGKIDLILTDPPYNTGNDFRYNDKWDQDPNDPGLGEWVASEDGARRTKWMKFMWPRLAMMKAMLKPGGVLAICIDHRELFRLGQMLDELFGENNRLAIIPWQKLAGAKNQDQGVSTVSEYVLVYSKDASRTVTGKVQRSAATEAGYRSRDGDARTWVGSDSTLMGAESHPGQVYGIQNPFTGRIHYPQQGRCWRNEREKMRQGVEAWGLTYEDRDLHDGLRPALVITGLQDPLRPTSESDQETLRTAKRIAEERHREGSWPRYYWRDDRRRRAGHGELRYKTYADEVAEGVVPTTFWPPDDFDLLDVGSAAWTYAEAGTTDQGVKELNAIVGRGHRFDTVKPLALFKKLITVWCPTGGTVMDPFAGSGTTGHAVLSLNKETGADRRFILIEQGRPDRGDPYATALTARRLRQCITGERANETAEELPGGFEFLRLGQKVDASTLLKMERDEMVDTVIESHFDATRRKGAQLTRCTEDRRYLVAYNSDDEGFFLVWDGPKKNTDITEEVYEQIVAEAAESGLGSATYHVYARLWIYQTDDVRFLQIPDRILADFGLDARNEPFADLDAEQ